MADCLPVSMAVPLHQLNCKEVLIVFGQVFARGIYQQVDPPTLGTMCPLQDITNIQPADSTTPDIDMDQLDPISESEVEQLIDDYLASMSPDGELRSLDTILDSELESRAGNSVRHTVESIDLVQSTLHSHYDVLADVVNDDEAFDDYITGDWPSFCIDLFGDTNYCIVNGGKRVAWLIYDPTMATYKNLDAYWSEHGCYPMFSFLDHDQLDIVYHPKLGGIIVEFIAHYSDYYLVYADNPAYQALYNTDYSSDDGDVDRQSRGLLHNAVSYAD